jgi:GH24 family phage-related lysozyme (muramidase)
MDSQVKQAMDIWHLHALLREGRKGKVYLDSLGKPTGGIGHLLKHDEIKKYPVGTILSDALIEKWFVDDSQKALETSLKHWAEIGKLTAPFLAALISVNFQLGDFSVKFKNSYKLLKEHKFDQAIVNIKGSLWARQTPVRVKDFVTAIEKIK